MAAQAQAQLQVARGASDITLRGSAETVAEFFGFAVNSILYQRGVYPPESFATVAKYGLSAQVTSDEGLKTYLAAVLRQLAGWLAAGAVKKLVVVLTGVESRETLERWVFHVETDKAALVPGSVAGRERRTRAATSPAAAA